MDFGYSQEQLELKETLRAFGEREIVPIQDKMDRDAEYPLELFQQLLRTTYVARRAHADGNRMLSFGSHCKEGVECHNSVDFRHGDSEFGGYDPLHLFGQIAVQMLRFMQNID